MLAFAFYSNNILRTSKARGRRRLKRFTHGGEVSIDDAKRNLNNSLTLHPMNKISFILLLLLATSFTTKAQFSQGAKDSAKIEIQQLTSDWNKAIINRDSMMLDKILAPEYSLNGSVNRSTWMNNTMHHIITDTLDVLGQLNITFYGQAAKSEGTFFWKATFDGKPRINGEYAVSDIWIKRNGHWQILLRMSLLSKMK